ncbi:MAG: hypothetical protein HQL72_08430 [Magnetococcales bacterium]|nr:hypothetical protein [Magnetococcales bacterium]
MESNSHSLSEKDFEKALEENAESHLATAGQLYRFYQLAKKHASIRITEQVAVEEVMTDDVVTIQGFVFFN